MNKTYNEWTNYETWLISLYVDGNYDGEGTYRYFKSLFESNLDRYQKEKQLKEEIENSISEQLEQGKIENNIINDLVNAALSEVNWQEIVDAKMNDLEN